MTKTEKDLLTGMLHVEPKRLVQLEEMLEVWAFRGRESMTVQLTEESAFKLGCTLLAWVKQKEDSRKLRGQDFGYDATALSSPRKI